MLMFVFLGVILAFVLIYSLAKVVAPANELERKLDDQDQMDYLDNLQKKR